MLVANRGKLSTHWILRNLGDMKDKVQYVWSALDRHLDLQRLQNVSRGFWKLFQSLVSPKGSVKRSSLPMQKELKKSSNAYCPRMASNNIGICFGKPVQRRKSLLRGLWYSPRLQFNIIGDIIWNPPATEIQWPAGQATFSTNNYFCSDLSDHIRIHDSHLCQIQWDVLFQHPERRQSCTFTIF